MGFAKYIVIREIDGTELMYVFSNTINHASFLKNNLKPKEAVVSAGFVSVFVNNDNEPECNCLGESVTIGVKARPEKDSFLANQLLRTGGFY